MEVVMTAALSAVVTTLLWLWRNPSIRQQFSGWVAEVTKPWPRWAQPIPPILLGVLFAAGEGLHLGLSGDALWTHLLNKGLELGLLAIALWHVVKRVRAKSPARP